MVLRAQRLPTPQGGGHCVLRDFSSYAMNCQRDPELAEALVDELRLSIPTPNLAQAVAACEDNRCCCIGDGKCRVEC